MNETYLAHHGVKGMRWGVRRQQRRAHREAIREQQSYEKQQNRRRVVAIGAAAIGSALAIYGSKKAVDYAMQRNARRSQDLVDQYIKLKQREIDSLIADALKKNQ